jgi:ParB/RepB/Spo0J family partition protein
MNLKNDTSVAPPAPPLTTVPIGTLVPSPVNARRHHDPKSIETLADSILASGLLQNLVVREVSWPKDAAPFRLNGEKLPAYEVIAGGRRMRALALNVKRGKAAWGDAVPVRLRVCSDREAAVLSMKENRDREDLHALDEAEDFDALRKMLKAEGYKARPEEEVARQLGTSPRTVFRRLELLSLAPELKDAYRAGDINDQQARAFAIGAHDDQRAQLKRAKREQWALDPGRIKEAMIAGRVPARAALFDLDLYTGERLVDDDNKGAVYLVDVAQFTKLQRAALDKKIEELKAKHAFVIEKLRGERDYYAVFSGYQRFGGAAKDTGVLVVTNKALTEIKIETGWVTDVDADTMAKAQCKKQARRNGGGGRDEDRRLVTKAQAVAAKHAKTRALRAGVAANPKAAMAAAITALVCDYGEIRLHITGGGSGDDYIEPTEAEAARRDKALAPLKAAFTADGKKKQRGEAGQAVIFEAALALKPDQQLAIFAELIGAAIGTWPGYQGRPEDTALQIAVAKAVSAAQLLPAYWQPELSYFAAYPAAQLDRIGRAVLGEDFAGEFASLKRGDKAAYVAGNFEHFNDPGLYPELAFADADTMAKAMKASAAKPSKQGKAAAAAKAKAKPAAKRKPAAKKKPAAKPKAKRK